MIEMGVSMGRRPKYPHEVSIQIPREMTELYETPVLKLLLAEKEAEMAQKIIDHIKKNGRLWPDEWKIIAGDEYNDIKTYYRAMKKMVSLGLLSRGDEGSWILSDKLSRKLTVLIEKVNALVEKG